MNDVMGPYYPTALTPRGGELSGNIWESAAAAEITAIISRSEVGKLLRFANARKTMSHIGGGMNNEMFMFGVVFFFCCQRPVAVPVNHALIIIYGFWSPKHHTTPVAPITTAGS